ncbi:MAG: class I SAM-dependent methyltransferase [Acidimicrobiia bacterium]
MTAADNWRQQLEAWKIPDELLAAVDQSPYGWPKRLWKERGERGLGEEATTPTTEIASQLAGPGGAVLDIGAGTGRASFPLTRLGHPVTMLEPNPTMVSSLRELVADRPVAIVEGRWPEVAEFIDPHAVAMSAHVVYDVPDLVPFLEAMDQKGSGAVIEMTPEHPWSNLTELYYEFHRLARPDGPTSDDLVAVVRELGRVPEVERWSRPSDMAYESVSEIIEITGRRLVLPPSRWPELEKHLLPRIVGEPGALQVSPLDREITTVWWRTADSL